MFFSKKFILTGDAGQEVGSVVLRQLWADVYCIGIHKSLNPVAAELWAKEIGAALIQAEKLPMRQVLFRLIIDDSSVELANFLPGLGFCKKQNRIEYQKTVEALPDDFGTPLVWRSAAQLGFAAGEIAKTLTEVSTGDPGHDPNEDPLQFIEDFLADPVLTAGLECIHFGFIADEIAALTVVQINPKNAWSRISYMGVVPQFRKQGLGKWVHRFSFAEMKRQGGKLYHGGTVADNLPMIRLFETHECRLLHRMQEWSYTTKRGQR